MLYNTGSSTYNIQDWDLYPSLDPGHKTVNIPEDWYGMVHTVNIPEDYLAAHLWRSGLGRAGPALRCTVL